MIYSMPFWLFFSIPCILLGIGGYLIMRQISKER